MIPACSGIFYMPSTAVIKFVRSLQQKKFRAESKLFVVEGEKGVAELLSSGWPVHEVFGLPAWIDANKALLHNCSAPIVAITPAELERMSSLDTPNRVMALAQMPIGGQVPEIPPRGLVLALDGIRDPGNLGTIIRTANWFGVNQIVCSPDCVDAYSPKVIQATMGSFAKVQIACMELKEWIVEHAAHLPVYGALMQGQALHEVVVEKHGILVIGSESHGIRPDVLPLITKPVHIPHYQSGSHPTAESLNASVACAILLNHFSLHLFHG